MRRIINLNEVKLDEERREPDGHKKRDGEAGETAHGAINLH